MDKLIQTDRYASQGFKNGIVFWGGFGLARYNGKELLVVLYENGKWELVEIDEYNVGDENRMDFPHRTRHGIGKMLSQKPEIAAALGDATTNEFGSYFAWAQVFGKGALWHAPLPNGMWVTTALLDNGTWRQF